VTAGRDLQNLSKKDVLILLVAALLVRLLYFLSIRDTPLIGVPKVDTKVVWDEAIRLVREGAGDPVYFKPPLFGWFLALIVKCCGDQLATARIALACVSALAAPLTAGVAAFVLDRKGALLAGAMVALYAPAVFYGAEVLPTTLVLVNNLLLLLILLKAEKLRDWRWAAGAGLVLGLSALARATILLLLPLLLWRYRRRLKFLLALLLATVAVILPVTLHNVAGGSLVLISSNGGLNFYMGNNGISDGKSAQAPGLPNDPFEARAAAEELAERARGRPLSAAEISNYWYGQGLAWIGENPVKAFGLFGRKLYYLLNNHEIADNVDFYGVQEQSWPLRLVPFRLGLLLILFLAGWSRVVGRCEGRLLLIYGLSVALPSVLFFMVGRFRLPLLPVLAVGAAAGWWRLWEGRRAGLSGLGRPLALMIAGAIVTFTPLLGTAEDTSWHYYFHCADALYREGRIDEAIAAYETSVRRNDRIADTRNALAFLYAEKGVLLDRAESLVRGALRLDPERRRYYLDSLGWVLLKKGDAEGAAEVLNEALGLFPASETRARAEALYHLAHVRRAQGREREAVALFRQAAPDYPEAAKEIMTPPRP
jgi:tetratricopeptide (TPR) repeat protein